MLRSFACEAWCSQGAGSRRRTAAPARYLRFPIGAPNAGQKTRATETNPSAILPLAWSLALPLSARFGLWLLPPWRQRSAAPRRIPLFEIDWVRINRIAGIAPNPRRKARLARRHPRGRFRLSLTATQRHHPRYSTRPGARHLPRAESREGTGSGPGRRIVSVLRKTSSLLYKTESGKILHLCLAHVLTQISSLLRMRQARMLSAFVVRPRLVASSERRSIFARCSPR